MRYTERRVFRGILNHCYQRTEEGVVIFYTVSDFLVFFTHFCTTAKRHDVRVLSLCLMPDHIHHGTYAHDRDVLSGFVRDYTARFSFQHNRTCHYDKKLFESPFGSAPKFGGKKTRTNLIYIGNNPVERRLCTNAEDYRWNFLAYAVSPHPFSAPLVIRRASLPMCKAIQEIKNSADRLQPLSYRQLQRLFTPLSRPEREQLTDYIVSTYNVLDYDAAIQLFGSYENMILAMHATTGSEYDLNEIHIGKSDACYAKLSAGLMRRLCLDDIHDLFLLPERERAALLPSLVGQAEALPEQVSAFLRLGRKV
jgi:REP element-mobilizing transposase RayT